MFRTDVWHTPNSAREVARRQIRFVLCLWGCGRFLGLSRAEFLGGFEGGGDEGNTRDGLSEAHLERRRKRSTSPL